MKDTLISKVEKRGLFTACLNKMKVSIGKHFFRYFQEKLGTHLKAS